MSLPRHAPVSCAPRAHGFRIALSAALALLAAPAFATHYVVDLNGGGDFATIKAALHQQWFQWRDSIFIHPGCYPETIALDLPVPRYLGPLREPGWIEIDSLASTNYWSMACVLDHLVFRTHVELGYGLFQSAEFRSCVFKRGISSGAVLPPSFIDCDFHGLAKFGTIENPGYPIFRGSRFHSAPLSFAASNGDVRAIDCTFEGPADTLIHLFRATNDDRVSFAGCTFSQADHGIVADFGFGAGLVVRASVFRDLEKAGIWYEQIEKVPPWFLTFPFGCEVDDSRFEACGEAVHWRGLLSDSTGRWVGVNVLLQRDTVVSCTSNGLDVGPLSRSGIYNCLIDGSGGAGAVVRQEVPATGGSDDGLSIFVTISTFRNNRGDGLVLRDTAATAHESVVNDLPGPDFWIRGCTFSGNGGRGLEVSTADWSVEGCTALANGSDGFAWSTSAPGMPSELSSNTSVFNRGDGYRATRPTRLGDSLQFIQNNLAAMNAGAGFRMPSVPFGSLARNDSWGNYLAPYLGAWGSLDSNLAVNPRFCDLPAGVTGLGLEQGSPCGPSGVYGLIGARPEECPNTLAVGSGAPSALAFAVRPSIARGLAEFVPPATGGEGVVELHDLAGRVVWRAPLGPATSVVRWHGEGESGRVRAGLYWARFTCGAERATRRLVWLE